MKLYISKATLRTIEKFGNASLTHISATPSDHMSVELDATPLANEASKPACAHRIVDARNEIVKSGYLCVDCGAVFAGIHAPAAPLVEQDERGAFLDWWCADVPENLREGWKERVDQCLRDGNATDRFQKAWEGFQFGVKLARAASTSANVAQGAEAFDECPASGQSCSYAPEGRRGEMQCRYCGKPQTALTDADLRTAVWQIAAIDTSFETEIRDGMKILRDLIAAQSASGDSYADKA